MSDRTDNPIDFERSLVDWLEGTAPDREPPDLLGRVLETTAVTRRRPAWWKPGRPASALWLPRQAAGRTLAVAAIVALLILALALAFAIGSRPQVPLPLGQPGLLLAGRLGELLLVDGSGAIHRRVSTGELWGYGAWSRDGSRLAHGDGAVTDPFLVVTNADLDVIARIRVPAGTVPAFSWSPDGHRIAFGVENDTEAQIYVVDVAAGAVPVPITEIAIDARGPSWSPDGSLIAFRAGVPLDQQALYVMRPDGTGITRLSEHGRAVMLTCGFPWLPDGRSILFETRFAGVWTVDRDGANERALIGGSTPATCPSVSPDGKRIAASVDTTTGVRGWIVDLGVVVGDVGLELPHAEIPGPLWDRLPAVWSPDGRSIAVNGRVLDGGPMPRLIVDPDGIRPARTFFIDNAVIVDWQRLPK
jgi:hypothetical protein